LQISRSCTAAEELHAGLAGISLGSVVITGVLFFVIVKNDYFAERLLELIARLSYFISPFLQLGK
jgi:hypothetical protein